MLTQKMVLICTLGASLTIIGADKTPHPPTITSFPVSDREVMHMLHDAGHCLAGCFWGCFESRSCMNPRNQTICGAPQILIMGSKPKSN